MFPLFIQSVLLSVDRYLELFLFQRYRWCLFGLVTSFYCIFVCLSSPGCSGRAPGDTQTHGQGDLLLQTGFIKSALVPDGQVCGITSVPGLPGDSHCEIPLFHLRSQMPPSSSP